MKKPLSIYIHIPFCVSKCAYCDFLSAPASMDVWEQYLHMLKREIKDKLIQYKETHILYTMFIGGGTPSIVDANMLSEVVYEVLSYMEVRDEIEISIECNPGTVTREKLEMYRRAGINRISIGLQSTQDQLLKKLGRIHTYEQFLHTYQTAREVGFENINIDLMSALPGQTLADYKRTLEEVLSLKPEHISAYSLIVEEGTPFYDMELDLPDEDTERAMYELTKSLLHDQGYERYEISNYAKSTYECKHNKVYWEGGDYLSFGIGGASYMAGMRFKNHSGLERYLQGDFSVEDVQVLTSKEQAEEFFFLGLREMKGVDLEVFIHRFGQDMLDQYQETIERFIKEGLLVHDKNLCLTDKGIDVSNVIFLAFLD
ncbi:MAG: radical SAM family heme chaperone HemW [Lachnospiraceae bacterium]